MPIAIPAQPTATASPVAATTLQVAGLASAPPALRPHYPRSFLCTENIAGMERFFDEDIAICIWRRTPDARITEGLQTLQAHQSRDILVRLDTQQFRPVELRTLDPTPALQNLPDMPGRAALMQDIGELIELFTTLADCRHVGLRLSITTEQTCPRFHVDHVDLRLVCTWHGPATQWLEHQSVDRALLGRGANGHTDETSGAIRAGAQIHQLRTFDVALLKGERYPGNAGRGAVHRSPPVPTGALRVMLSLDTLE